MQPKVWDEHPGLRGSSMMVMKRGACGSQMNTVLRDSSGIPGLQEPPGPGRGGILCSRAPFHCGGDRARWVPSGMFPSAQARERPTAALWECRGWVQEICREVAEGFEMDEGHSDDGGSEYF